MSSGWKIDVLARRKRTERPARIHYVVAIGDQKAALKQISRTAHVGSNDLEVIAPLTDDDLLNFGLQSGEVTRIEVEVT